YPKARQAAVSSARSVPARRVVSKTFRTFGGVVRLTVTERAPNMMHTPDVGSGKWRKPGSGSGRPDRRRSSKGRWTRDSMRAHGGRFVHRRRPAASVDRRQEARRARFAIEAAR